MPILRRSKILEIYEASLKLGLFDKRVALLAGLDPTLTSRLPFARDPASQLLVDLETLNSLEVLDDGTMPLLEWLRTASALSPARVEAEVFDRYADSLAVIAKMTEAEIDAQPRLSAPVSALFGRDPELAILQRTSATFHSGRSVVALIRGAEGMGKSALVEAFARSLDGAIVLRAKAEAAFSKVDFSLARALVLSHAELVLSPQLSESLIGERGGLAAIQELVRKTVADPIARSTCVLFLGELFDVDVPPAPELISARGDRQLMRDRLHAALLDYFFSLIRETGKNLRFIAEDVHWADAASLQVLEHVFDAADEGTFFLLASARPELEANHEHLFSGDQVQRIELAGLDVLALKTMSAQITGRPISDAFASALLARTGGCPLFVQQIVSKLYAEGATEANETNLLALPLPPTIEDAVRSRLTALPSELRVVCSRASLLSPLFFWDEARLIGIDDPASLDKLVALSILTTRNRRSLGRGQEYRFASPIFAEVAARLLNEGEQAELHRVLAEHFATSASAEPERTARHFELAGHAERAAVVYAEAAVRALRKGDDDAVLRCSAKALELNQGQETPELLLARHDALQFKGKGDEQRALLERAVMLAPNAAFRVRVLTELSRSHTRSGRLSDAVEVGERALEEARSLGDVEAIVLALGRTSVAWIAAGKLDEASANLREADLLVSGTPPHVRALVAGWASQLAAARGEPSARHRACERAIDAYNEAGDLRRAAGARANLADVHNRLGAYFSAESELRAAIAECRRVGHRTMEGYASANLGYSLAMQRRRDEARAALEFALEAANAVGDPRLSLAARLYRGRAELGNADADAMERLALADELRAIAIEADQRRLSWLEISARTLEARARLELDDVRGALEVSGRALAILERPTVMEEDEAEVYLVHARALARSGRTVDSAAVHERGRRRVLELADQIQDKILRAQFCSQVEAHRALLSDTLVGSR